MTYTFSTLAHHFTKFLCKDYIISRRVPFEIVDGFAALYGIDLSSAECYQFNLLNEGNGNKIVTGTPNVFIVEYNINLKDYNSNNNSNVEIVDFAMAPGFVVFMDENIHEEGYSWEKAAKDINDAIEEIVVALTPSGFSSLRSRYYSLVPCYSTIIAICSRYSVSGKELCKKLNKIHHFSGGIIRYTPEEIDNIVHNIIGTNMGSIGTEEAALRDSFFNVLTTHDFSSTNPTYNEEDFIDSDNG